MSNVSFESEPVGGPSLLQDTQLRDIAVHILVAVIASVLSLCLTKTLIKSMKDYLKFRFNLSGVDMGKKSRKKIPESLGIVVGLTYLASFIACFIIAPYVLTYLRVIESFSLSDKLCASKSNEDSHNYSTGLSNLAAITSISAMLFLGFIDDCCNLRWRYKLIFPFAASLPLVGVYYYNYNEQTTILVPYFLTRLFGMAPTLNLGIFYYIYMLMFVIFCTNAINIYAGINGLEVGQSIVMTIAIIVYNMIEMKTKLDCDEVHVFSIQLLLPFLFGSYALYEQNRYPAKVFVGDSYCYFAGIVFGVVGILGHFSEEILLFALPQIFNFILSIPQIFKLVPCPRHRLPRYLASKDKMEPSKFAFEYEKLSSSGRLVMRVYTYLGLARIETPNKKQADRKKSNNFTLLNLWLRFFGPMHEKNLCKQLLLLQTCLAAFWLVVLAAIKSEYLRRQIY